MTDAEILERNKVLNAEKIASMLTAHKLAKLLLDGPDALVMFWDYEYGTRRPIYGTTVEENVEAELPKATCPYAESKKMPKLVLLDPA